MFTCYLNLFSFVCCCFFLAFVLNSNPTCSYLVACSINISCSVLFCSQTSFSLQHSWLFPPDFWRLQINIILYHVRSENQSSVGEITLQGKITSLDLSRGKSHIYSDFEEGETNHELFMIITTLPSKGGWRGYCLAFLPQHLFNL